MEQVTCRVGIPSAERARGTGLLHAKRARCRWILRALKCFKGAGGPYPTPALIVHPTVVPCASTAHPNQRVDFNELLSGCRGPVLLFKSLHRRGQKQRRDPESDLTRLADGAILHDGRNAGDATAVTVSTCCAGPPLALRSWRMTRHRRRRGSLPWPEVLPAMIGPAGKNTERTSGAGVVLPSGGGRTRRGVGNRRVRGQSRPGSEP